MNIEDRFKKQDDILAEHTRILENQSKSLDRIENFMNNMSGFSNFVRGMELLRRPAMWFLAFIIGLVTLLGGLKALTGWFISLFITKT